MLQRLPVLHSLGIFGISGKLITPAFFYRNVPAATKVDTIAAMNLPVDDGARKRCTEDLAKIAQLTFADFVTQAAKQLIDS